MADSTLTIVGTLGRDPELKYTQGGAGLCSFTLAVSRRFKKGDEWQEKTSWVDVTAWGDLGENIAASCRKGMRMIVTGYLDEDEWTDKETDKRRTKLKMIADAAGPELRFARCEVERIERQKS